MLSPYGGVSCGKLSLGSNAVAVPEDVSAEGSEPVLLMADSLMREDLSSGSLCLTQAVILKLTIYLFYDLLLPFLIVTQEKLNSFVTKRLLPEGPTRDNQSACYQKKRIHTLYYIDTMEYIH